MNDSVELPDHYQVLGVLRSATAADITSAYHSQASQCHPDVSEAPADLARFKAITQAYEILSDEFKRRDYDHQIASATPGPRRSNRQRQPGCFDSWFRSEVPHSSFTAKQAELELPITPEEAAYGGECEFFLTVPISCHTCQGGRRVNLLQCAACHGAGTIRQRRSIHIVLPPGLRSGSLLRVVRHSSIDSVTEDVGEVLLRIRIRPCW